MLAAGTFTLYDPEPHVPHKRYPFTPRVTLKDNPWANLRSLDLLDAIAVQKARMLARTDPRATGITNTYNEVFFSNRADYTAVSTTTAETSLLAGSTQPYIPAGYFLNAGAAGRGVRITARGVLGTTSTPTIIFQVRLGTTAGATFLSGASVGVTAAITTASGVSNQQWALELDLICTVQGSGTNAATLAGAGSVRSGGGFASPFEYALQPTTPPTATWTQTFDASLTQFPNISVTWSASSASNTITCKQLICTAFA